MESNKEQQLEEIEAIEAIYPEIITDKLADFSMIHIKVPSHEYINLQISFPSNYPSDHPPNIIAVNINEKDSGFKQLHSYDTKYLLKLFKEVLDSVFHKDSVCLFDFLGELDGILYVDEQEVELGGGEEIDVEQLLPSDPFEGWISSDPITDRGSTFVAFATHVTSEEDAFQKLDWIKTDSKMRKAAHIMSAWRIKVSDKAGNGGNELMYQDCDDDGETAAGSRMLHLISIMDVWNVMVIVARWFGGTHIGPDRFKHINSTAREAVIRAGFEPKK